MSIFTSEALGQSYSREILPNGLTLLLYPMPDFRTTYASVTARFGSIDNRFSCDGGPELRLPDGCAHFMEHKLFENEDGDAFDRYAKTGANANAYTSFTHTSYLFTCTGYLEENLRILFELVSSPWFTEQSVEKEQGIIAEEIQMYRDDPDWQALSALLDSLYKEIPLGIDLAGSQASIAEITPEVLYSTYSAFYNPSNLTVLLTGPFDADLVRKLCLEYFPQKPAARLSSPAINEPREIVRNYSDQKMAVSQPQFCLGFKEKTLVGEELGFRSYCLELLLDSLIGEVSELYRKLYDACLINETFSYEVLNLRGYCAATVYGESRDPRKVYDAICETLEKAGKTGLSKENFERSRRALYGRMIRSLGTPESVAGMVLDAELTGTDLFTVLKKISSLTLEEINQILKESFSREHSSLSLILPEEIKGDN